MTYLEANTGTNRQQWPPLARLLIDAVEIGKRLPRTMQADLRRIHKHNFSSYLSNLMTDLARGLWNEMTSVLCPLLRWMFQLHDFEDATSYTWFDHGRLRCDLQIYSPCCRIAALPIIRRAFSCVPTMIPIPATLYTTSTEHQPSVYTTRWTIETLAETSGRK